MKNKPDDRRDNVEKIQRNIDMTIRNMEMAEELIEKSDDEKMQQQLKEKNKRRRAALEGMRYEIADEAHAREEDYYSLDDDDYQDDFYDEDYPSN